MDTVKIKCINCGEEFLFTEREQQFYAEKGFVPPKRCKNCRNVRILRQNEQNNFRKENI